MGDREQNDKELRKLSLYFNTCIDWLQRKQRGVHIQEYLLKSGYNKIAIYGMGEFGVSLEKELRNSGIEVKYGIDQTAYPEYIDTELKICRLDHRLEQVDAIVVTVIHEYEAIRDDIEKNVGFPCKILSLEELIYG